MEAESTEITRPPTRLTTNFEWCELLELGQENARTRGAG